MHEKPIFEEKQYFRQVWIWVLLLTGNISMIYFLATGDSMDTKSEYIVMLISAFLTFGVTALIYFSCLHTKITKKGIYIKFFPLINNWKKYEWKRIDNMEVKRYNPIADYGGWGVRITLDGSRAYNISGDIGIAITLKNRKSVLIGTQKPDELKHALQQLS